jgi:hypothetical protein
MQSSGAAANGDGVGDGVIFGEGGFERCQFGTEAEMRGAQDGGDGNDFGLGDVGCGEGNVRRGRVWDGRGIRPEMQILRLAVLAQDDTFILERGAGSLTKRFSRGMDVKTLAMAVAAVPLPYGLVMPLSF